MTQENDFQAIFHRTSPSESCCNHHDKYITDKSCVQVKIYLAYRLIGVYVVSIQMTVVAEPNEPE